MISLPNTTNVQRHHFAVMGTVFSFAWRQPPTVETVAAVERELERIDAVFSTFRPDSEISAVAAGRLTAADCSSDVRT